MFCPHLNRKIRVMTVEWDRHAGWSIPTRPLLNLTTWPSLSYAAVALDFSPPLIVMYRFCWASWGTSLVQTRPKPEFTLNSQRYGPSITKSQFDIEMRLYLMQAPSSLLSDRLKETWQYCCVESALLYWHTTPTCAYVYRWCMRTHRMFWGTRKMATCTSRRAVNGRSKSNRHDILTFVTVGRPYGDSRECLSQSRMINDAPIPVNRYGITYRVNRGRWPHLSHVQSPTAV